MQVVMRLIERRLRQVMQAVNGGSRRPRAALRWKGDLLGGGSRGLKALQGSVCTATSNTRREVRQLPAQGNELLIRPIGGARTIGC